MAERTDVSAENVETPSADGRRSLLRYLAIGGLSYVIDTGLLVIISGPLGRPVWIAATIGFWTSVIVNFSLNRSVFSREGSSGSVAAHGTRYAMLLAVNYVVTLAVVAFGTSRGLHPAIPKTFVVALTTCWNFVLYRRWVFR